MATQVQFRRGTTTQNNAFTGAIAELTVDTEAKTIRLHDGSTAGGGAIVATLAGTQTFTNKTHSSNSVWQGTTIGLAYGGTNASLTAVAGAVVYSGASALAISAAGTSGQVLTSAGASAPTWTAQSSLVVGTATVATTATNIAGGSAGNLVFQLDTNQTSFIPPGTSGQVLKSTGASTAPNYVDGNITIGSTTVNLGTTSTSIAGLTAIDATSGATSFFATSTAPVAFAGATTLTLGYGSTASSTTNISTGAVGSGNTKTINIGTGGAAGSTTNINLGDGDGGTVTVNKDLVVTGDLTINGTTTTVNSTTLDVDDINITVAKGAANAAAANGAGLTVDGASATILYTSATDSWNFNKPLKATNTDYWLIPVGNTAARPGTPATGMIRYNSQISSFEGYAASAWASLGGVKSVDGFTFIQAETSAGNSNGDLDFYAEDSAGTAATQVGQWNRTNLKDYTGTLVGTQTTQNVFNATATTVNAFGASTALTIGATTGTATLRNATVAITNAATVGSTLAVTGATTLTGALAANGGITVDTSNFTVDGTTGAVSTASTLSVTGASTLLSTLDLGHASDTTIARSAAGVVTIEGVEIVTLSRSQTLTNKTLTLPTIGGTGAAFSGSTSGTTTVVATAAAGTTTLTLPAATDTLVGKATTDTLTNKTLTSPTLTTPVLGTPSSGTLTNCTGLPVSGITASTSTALGVGSIELGHASDTTIARSSAGVVTIEGVTIATASNTLTLTNKTLTSPTLTTPVLGTPSSGTLTSCTGLPISTGVSGLGTGVATALAVNVGSAGAFVTNGGALGTPSSGTLTNCTFPTLNQNTTGSAARLTTGRTIAITGDLTYTSGSFNGSANVTGTGTLATVNSNTGSFGSATLIPVITVNAKGLVTAVTTSAVQGGQYFGTAATKAITYNSNSIAENITVTAGNNGLSAGPITIADGYAVTIADGATWTIV